MKNIEPEEGKTYILTEDFSTLRFQIKANTKFKVLYTGSQWDNHTVLEILDGQVKLICPTSFFDNSGINHIPMKDYKFCTLEEFEEIYGIPLSKLKVSYDPFGSDRFIPCKEV